MQRVFGVARINAKSNGVLTVVPTDDPYFEPNRIQFRSFDCMGEKLEHLDFTIGAVTVGGSPQLAVNTLVPDEVCTTGSINSRDLDRVNWSIFSTVGLARELQISIYNPHEVDLLIYVCLEGELIPSLDCYADSVSVSTPWSEEEKTTLSEEEKRRRLNEEHKKRKTEYDERLRKEYEERVKKESEKIRKWKSAEGGLQHAGSEIVELKPFERRAIQVIPTCSPYFQPWGARYHCSRVSDNVDVPLILVDAICGKTVMFGGLLSSEEFLNGWMASFELVSRNVDDVVIDDESPYDTLVKLKMQIELLEREGMEGIRRKRRENTKRLRAPEISGIPSILLQTSKFDDWHEILDFPIFSTLGLVRHLHFLVYNPWPFSVRASVTVCGQPAEGHPAEGQLKVVG